MKPNSSWRKPVVRMPRERQQPNGTNKTVEEEMKRNIVAIVTLVVVCLAASPSHAAKTCAQSMPEAKAALDQAPASAKKQAALKHYQAAEAALKSGAEKTCLSEVMAVKPALK